MPGDCLEPCGFDALPGWQVDDLRLALEAFRRCAEYAREGSYRSGALGPGFAAFASAYAASMSMVDCSPQAARRFFEQNFTPYRIAGPGFVTAYYEPVAPASLVPTARFRFPVYSRPDDLIEIKDADRPPVSGSPLRFGRIAVDGRLVEYHDRRDIESGALAGRKLEIAWLAERVDLFFIHVQGAARLQLEDGRQMRITYAAKSGHEFTGPGQVLAELGELRREEVTMQAIRSWLASHPDRIDEVLWRNRSFIFFREAPVADPALGPIAAAKVPLMPGRSLAVDRLLHTFSTPFYIDAPELRAVDGQSFGRLMIAQDTGSAITGPARGDLFIGSGDAAGEIAGVVKHPASFYCLLPKFAGMPR